MLIAVLLDQCRNRSYKLYEHMIFQEDDLNQVVADMLPSVQAALFARLLEIEGKSYHDRDKGWRWRNPTQVREYAQREFDGFLWNNWNTQGIASDDAQDYVIKLLSFDYGGVFDGEADE